MLSLSETLLLNSIQHFDDITDIDTRSYFLTIHVNYKTQLETCRKLVYYKITRMLNNNIYRLGPHRPALIIADDVEGSRDHLPELSNPIYPHLHALLIMPDSVNDITMMSNVISSIREVKKVDIIEYDYRQPLPRLIDYVLKLQADGFNFGVYPYETDIAHRRKHVRETVTLRSNNLYSSYATPELFYSNRYTKKFGL